MGWCFRALCRALLGLTLGAGAAQADDEIQVYNAEIAELGQWTVQQHLNYAIDGRKQPEFPGELIPNHTLNGTPEWAYGVTPWFELGFYAPFAVDNNGFHSDAGKIQFLFVTPEAAKKEFFYGINFEFGYGTEVFSQTRINMEIRPIVGWRRGDYEFIINPILDVGFGENGSVDFVPSVRFAKKVKEDVSVGFEYYAAFGPVQHFLPLQEEGHNLYGVVDFKVGRFDVEAGVGVGFTRGSDRLMTKLIIGTDLN